MRREPDFSKCGGLLPAIVQDPRSGEVLMLGYMNEEAYAVTLEEKRVTFFSRSRNGLWTKGETSGNYLTLCELSVDCDSDAILVKAIPSGPTCHEGTRSCFAEASDDPLAVLARLGETITERRLNPSSSSYTASLFAQGIDKIVQKVGEEGIEVVIEGKNDSRDRLVSESADLLFHLMVLWEARGISLADVCGALTNRAQGKN